MKLSEAQQKALSALPVEIWADTMGTGYSIKKARSGKMIWMDGMRITSFEALVKKGLATCKRIGPRCRLFTAVHQP